jgi:hypothetical protein
MKTMGVAKDTIHFCRTVAALCILLLAAPITLCGILVIKAFDACFPKANHIADSSPIKVSDSSRPVEEISSAPVKSASGPLNVLVTGGKMSKASWILRMLGKVGHNV